MNKLKTRSISFITAFMMSVMSIMTGISPVSAKNNVPNLAEPPAEVDDVTLLIGSKENKLRADTVGDTIENYGKEYALGIASQFCVFLKGDFHPTNSDAEGRIAVGGDLNFSEANQGWRYSIGRGDYVSHENLGVSLGDGNSDYAYVIWDGKENKVFYGVNLTDECYIQQWDGGGDAYQQVKDEKWRMVVQNQAGADYIKSDAGSSWDDEPNSPSKKYSNNLDRVYQGSLINFDKVYDELISRSGKLAGKKSDTKIEFYDGTVTVPYFQQYWPGRYQGLCRTEQVQGVTRFIYNNPSSSDKTIYFNVTEEQWNKIKDTQVFSFENIPEGAYIVVNVDGTIININDTGKDRYTYINNKSISKGTFSVVKPDGSIVDITDINSILSSNEEFAGTNEEFIQKRDAWLKKNFDEGAYITGMFNNYEDVDRILYNFPNATRINYKEAFQGTIFAPGAHVDSTNNAGHLSGALIADSAEGGMEFGYRPFTGPISMLGTKSGYALDFSKLKPVYDRGQEVYEGEGEDKKLTTEPLAGATIGLYKGDELVSDVITNGDKYNFINLPSSIEDHEFKKDEELPIILSENYILKEVSAPTGYIKSTDAYPVRIVEKINDVVTVDETILPAEVEVLVYRGGAVEPDENGKYDESALTLPTDEAGLEPYLIRRLTYTDSFDTDGNQTRTIVINEMTDNNLASVEIKFELTIENGEIKDVVQTLDGETSTPVTDYNTNTTFDVISGDNLSTYYYDAENMMITRIPEGNVPEFLNNGEEITLKKVNADTKAFVPGAEVSIYKKGDNGEKIDIITKAKITEEGIKLGHLEPGTYYIKEVTVPDGYITPENEIEFVIGDDFTISGEMDTENTVVKVDYTIKYTDSTAFPDVTGKDAEVGGKKEDITVNNVPKNTGLRKYFTETNIKDSDKVYLYDATGESNKGVDVSGKKITKIVFKDVVTNGGSAIQLKTIKQDGYDDQFAQLTLETADELTFESNGNWQFGTINNCSIKFTYWGVESIGSVTYYLAEDIIPYETLNDKAVVDSITLDFKDSRYAGSTVKVSDSGKEYTGIVDAEGKCEIEGINGTTFKSTPKISAVIEDSYTHIDYDKENAPLVIELPNEEKPSEKHFIRINKVNMRGDEVEGAELTLKAKDGISAIRQDKDGKDVPEMNWTSHANSDWTINDINDGTYILTETKAPNGYLISDKIEFVVEGGKITTVNGEAIKTDDEGNQAEKVVTGDNFVLSVKSETNKNYQELAMRDGRVLKLLKTKADGKTPLAGARFRLTAKDDDGEVIQFNTKIVTWDEEYKDNFRFNDADDDGFAESITWITTDKEAEIRNLPNGNYTLEETVAPNGYTKKSNITFKLYKGIISDVKGGTLVTNQDKDPETGEIKAPDTRGGGNTLYGIVVEDNDAEVSLMKRAFSGSNNLPVPGAKMSLTGVKTGTTDPIVFTLANVTIGDTVNGSIISEGETTEKLEWITGKEELKIKNIPDGTYTYHEEEAPDGYEPSPDITFEVKDGVIDLTTVKIKVSFDENAETEDYSYAKPGSVTMYDRKIVEISKQNEEGTSLDGATLILTGKQTVKVKDENGNIVKNPDGTDKVEEKDDVQFTDGNINKEKNAVSIVTVDKDYKVIENGEGTSAIQWKSDGLNNLELMGLPDGVYTLVETVVPDGYTKAENITFRIKDQKIDEKTLSNDTYKDGIIVMVDKEIITTTTKVTVDIEKIGSGSGTTVRLGGAKLSLEGKDADGNPIAFGEDYKEYFAETTQSTESVKTTTTTTTTTEEDIAVHAENDEKDSESSASTSSSTSTSPAGTSADDANVTTTATALRLEWTSSEKDVFSIELPEGTYTLKEVSAPDGFNPAGNIIFKVKNGEVTREDGVEVTNNKIVMIDDEIVVTTTTATINIEKIGSGSTTTRLAGATLELTGKDGTTPIVFGEEYKEYFTLSTVTNNSTTNTDTTTTSTSADDTTETVTATKLIWISDGKTFSIGLPDGEYILHEVSAPDGYTLAEDVKFT
ncbi:MAG: choice-of-anchor A family protein, partial [Ruminococcus sp.]|nr:choice-of-anchor A family protein [Ruminococcus sp.]